MGGTCRPSMLPTLTMRAGSSAVAASSSSGRKARVRKNGDLRFRSSTLSQADSGNVASGSPQVAPALLTRMCTSSSRSPTSAASRRHSSSRERSAGIDAHLPERRELGDGGVPGLGLAGADVDARAGLEQAAGHHQADPAGAAGDHGHLAGQVEQVHGHLRSGAPATPPAAVRHTIQRLGDGGAGTAACASLCP